MGKWIFDASARIPGQFNKRQCLEEIRSGINHLHSFGYCHNDINPGNVMFDAHDVAVVIDFDSAGLVGQELSFKAGTPGYGNVNAKLSKAKNDYYGQQARLKNSTKTTAGNDSSLRSVHLSTAMVALKG